MIICRCMHLVPVDTAPRPHNFKPQRLAMASPTTSNAVDKEANGVGIHDADTPSDGELRASDTVEWTPEEERKLVRRYEGTLFSRG